ncbi:MAG TPA: threonine synthase [Candidatus Atribacteria bacterium]|nr:threonine synthase [Candidatus Atribacteria bacterium]
MNYYILKCFACGKEYNDHQKSIYRCKKCGGSLEIIYGYDELAHKINTKILEERKIGVWKYKELLPVRDDSKIITLGEGGTKLHKCERLAEVLGIKKLYAKDETRNPTGTYKDRPATVGISKALEFGAKTIAIASDGNAGPATAAYAAKAGLKCYVFMPSLTPIERIVQVQAFGGKVILIKGTVSDCIDILTEVQAYYGWYQLTTAIPSNPYQAEGSKTIAYEICEDLMWNIPNWVVIPVGGGGLLTANWKGFKEFFKLGIITKLPKIAAVQAEGCAPLVKAYNEDKEKIEIWGKPKTIAITIGVPYPLDGTAALKAIRESKGIAVAVSDEEILKVEKLLAQTEGIFAEAAGVASLAGVKKLIGEGIINSEERVVFEVTGTGLKDLKSAMKTYEKPPCIEAKPKEVEDAVKFWERQY